MVTEPRGVERRFLNHRGWWESAAGDTGRLSQSAAGSRLREADGVERRFDTAGRLVSLAEPNGNELSLSYDGDSRRIVRIQHSQAAS